MPWIRLLKPARGSAMAETAVVLGFVLTLLFGAAQIELAGYYQLQLDTAAFLYSHVYALTNSVPYSQLTPVLPIVPSTSVQTVPSAPPNTEANDTNGSQVLGEYTTGGVPGGPTNPNANRYGGASIIRPQEISSSGALSLSSFDLSIFSNPVVMTSGDIEGRSMVSNHDDDATGYDYNSTLSTGDLVFPDTPTGDDQNVPPYYFSMAYMQQCNSNTGDYFDCANLGTNLYALGLAEYLKDDSNSSATNGNYTATSQGVGYGTMFGAMTCHQRFYASIAQLLTTAAYATWSAAQSVQPNALYTAVTEANNYDVNVSTLGGGVGGDYGTLYPQFPNYLIGGSC